MNGIELRLHRIDVRLELSLLRVCQQQKPSKQVVQSSVCQIAAGRAL
jgi:hypothetical protein